MEAPEEAKEPVAEKAKDGSPTALQLFQRRQYTGAARLWEAKGTPRSLFNAGMAREAAGHDALAIADWERYIAVAGEIAAEEREDLAQRIAAARGRLQEVRFQAEPTAARRELSLYREGVREDILRVTWPQGHDEVTVALDAVGWTAELRGGAAEIPPKQIDVRTETGREVKLVAPLQVSAVQLRLAPRMALRRGVEAVWKGGAATPARTVREETATWQLPRGTWTLQLSARGFQPVERAVELTGAKTELSVTLPRDPVDRARLGVGVGLGAGALVLAGVGAGLTAVRAGDPAFDEFAASGDCIEGECVGLNRARYGLATGVGVLGSGVGLGVAAGLSASPRRRAPAIGLGLGAALALGGISWYVFETTRNYPDGEFGRGELVQQQVASAMLGAGAGLLTGAVISELSRRIIRGRNGRGTRGRDMAIQSQRESKQ